MSSWVMEMQAMLDNPEQLGRIKTSIYKVPPFISNINETPYLPRVVSFGPYHHGEPKLALMEARKKRALICYVHRSGRTMQEVFDLVVEMAQELKDSYESLDSKWKDNTERFVQLMILDGCFMLELLQIAYKSVNYYCNDDPVFSQHGDLYVMPFIKADMLMLENQLPMLLLLRLKHILENVEPDIEALNKDILWLLNYDISKYSEMGKCLHVLDLYHKGLLHTHNEYINVGPQSPDQREGKFKWVSHNVVRPATELHKAGVHFMKSESKSLRDITFDGGVLKLPNFIVDDYTESIFLNLLAFECCHIPAGNDITLFLAFMGNIINDSWDIKLLSSKGIIENFIGSDKEAADLFNTMSKKLIIDYGNTPWHNCLSNLKDKSCKQEPAKREIGSWVVEMQAMLDNLDNGQSQEEQLGRMKTSIYKVPPPFISNINKKAYQPQLVSFGPYHHGEPHLASMEAHKKRALLRCIHRSGRPMREVFDLVAKMAEELKNSYDSLDSKWQDNNERFVQLMILDGCFMLELLRVAYHPNNFYSNNDPVFSQHGHLFVMLLIRADMLKLENQLPMSLLLKLKCILENDEPDIEDLNADILWLLSYDNINYKNMGECLHVLDLYRKSLLYRDNKHGNAGPQSTDQGAPQSPNQGKCDYPKMGKCLHKLHLYCKGLLHTHNKPADATPQSLDQRVPLQSPDQGAPSFLNQGTPQSLNQGTPQSPNQGKGDYPKMCKYLHKLYLYCKCLLHTHNKPEAAAPESHKKGEGMNKSVGHNVVRPATELYEAGVSFMKSESKSLLDITFDGGVLKLPNFIVDDYTESTFLNLIAFERCHIHAGNDVTLFVAFMDCIIDDNRDIKLLSSKGIIENFIGTDKEAADLFNTMSKDLVFDLNGKLAQVYNDLIGYCNTRWHKWRANLRQTYFRNPWAIISIIAAFILFSLTAVQTIFTILN